MSGGPQDAYKAGLDNTKGTWELLKDVLTFVSPSVSSAAQSRKAVKSLNDKIGEWAKEAKDKNGRWQQPMLTRDKLRAHLLQEKGKLQPVGECEASFAWAELLYALNIRPGKEILEWRASSEKNDPATTGTISLATEGEALCDIINLYQRYTGAISRKNEYRLSFGTLERKDDDQPSFTFKSISSVALKAVHKPFQHSFIDEDGLREGHLKLQEQAVMQSYLNALDVGVSDGAIRLESGKMPIKDRVGSLLRAMDILNERDWEKPHLLTPTWIEDATFIKRRVTTDGGQDTRLVDHIYKCISDRPEIVSELKMRVRKKDMWEQEVRDTIKRFCMFAADSSEPGDGDEDSFVFIWNTAVLNRSVKDRIIGQVKQQLQGAVEKLSEEPEGSWTRDLLENLTVEEIVKMLNLSHEVVNKPVVVLQQVPKEWGFIAEIQG